MAVQQTTTVSPSEQTPLLPVSTPRYGKSVLYRALLCGFMVSLSFGVTQVPLVYVFRLMTCEAYYQTHPDDSFPGTGDRCDIHQIQAQTAHSVALLGASTTLFGVLNLFLTNITIKRLGIKSALLFSVFWPAVRLAIQNVGVHVGTQRGILIIQCSQIITVLGGPAGYVLALNSFVAEVLEPEQRTGALGKLQGCTFFGTALAYMVGGLMSDYLGIEWPFRITVVLFLVSCVYVAVALPWLPPAVVGGKGEGQGEGNASVSDTCVDAGWTRFLGPLRMFTPQRWISRKSGKIRMEYGVLLLGIGVFLGVLSTGYQSVLLQMYATDMFGFGTTHNGYLISLNTFVQGIFLTCVFPRTISAGRKWLSAHENTSKVIPTTNTTTDDNDIPTSPRSLAALQPLDNEQEPTPPPPLPSNPDTKETFAFDLLYCRYSLLADSLITLSATFLTSGWQMYLLATILPFASGTGASAKGSILQMCPAHQRTDALGAITLVEMLARLTTTSVFGLVFAAFAQIGRLELIFVCNASVAAAGFCVLLGSRFPREGYVRLFGDGEGKGENEIGGIRT